MITTALDGILVLVVFEAIFLAAWHRWTGRGLSPQNLLPNLAAGFCLMLAVRLALTPALGALPLLACLAFALLAHLLDLAMRWRA